MNTFFTADTHFGHAGARSLFRRPFGSVAEADTAMVSRWNEVVAHDDEVWHLGDFAAGAGEAVLAARTAALLVRLNGRKYLVAGNNDPPTVRALPGWHAVREYAEIEQDGVGLVLCHYPLRSWRNQGRGWWNLHGHSHGRLAPLTRQADVGVDACDFQPLRFTALAAVRARRAGQQPLGANKETKSAV